MLRLEELNDYLVLDLETTGFSPKYDDILEFSGVKIRNGRVFESLTTFIRPSKRIPYHISSVNHIYDHMVADAPLPGQIMPKIREFLGNDVIVGHNVGFDLRFLDMAFRTYLGLRLSAVFFDTMALSKYVIRDVPNHKLATLSDFCGCKCQPKHRAEADCLSTHEILQYIKQRCKQYGMSFQASEW